MLLLLSVVKLSLLKGLVIKMMRVLTPWQEHLSFSVHSLKKTLPTVQTDITYAILQIKIPFKSQKLTFQISFTAFKSVPVIFYSMLYYPCW